MRRRGWLAPLIVVLLLGAAHTGYWLYLQSRLAEGLAAWRDARAAEGWTITAGATERAGWPLAAALRLHDLALSGGAADLPGGLDWHAETLWLGLDLTAPTALRLSAEGAQRLRLGRLPEFSYTAASFTGTLPLVAAPPQPVSLVARDLRANLSGVPEGSASGTGFGAGLLQLDATLDGAAGAGQPAAGFRLTGEAISLPAGRTWALGERISSASIEGELDGPVPAGRDIAARAASWRDGGGRFVVRDMAMGWGPLGLSGSALLDLDARLQPQGTATLRMVGYAAAMDALAAGRVLTQSAASAAKAVLSLLASAPASGSGSDAASDGGAGAVEVPLALRDRVLAMGPLPLVRLPELLWPEP